MMIEKIAYYTNDRSEKPNQDLGQELALTSNREGIREIASYLEDKNKSIASDCLKVLYEAAYMKPELIEEFYPQFLKLLKSKNNRMVWGAMIAIAQIAKIRAEWVYKDLDLILEKIETGSVITHIHGVYTLINISRCKAYYPALKPILFDLQKTCRPIDVAKRAESMIDTLAKEDLDAYMAILMGQVDHLSKGGQKRLVKLIKKYGY